MGFNRIYPLVNVYIAMENHHDSWVNQLLLWAIFNSYVKLPEGNGIGLERFY